MTPLQRAVTALIISAGRHWVQDSAPEADRLMLDFELTARELRPRTLLVGASADNRRVEVAHGGDGSTWRAVETRESDAWRYWTPLLDPATFAWYQR